jgi:hypothetical protein
MSKSGIPSITDMLSDGPHSRNLKETEKQSGRVTIVATIVWVGIAQWRNGRLTPLKSALLDFESNERLLYIPAS